MVMKETAGKAFKNSLSSVLMNPALQKRIRKGRSANQEPRVKHSHIRYKQNQVAFTFCLASHVSHLPVLRLPAGFGTWRNHSLKHWPRTSRAPVPTSHHVNPCPVLAPALQSRGLTAAFTDTRLKQNFPKAADKSCS